MRQSCNWLSLKLSTQSPAIYTPYLGTITAAPGASAEAAAIQAAYDVLVNYFPNSQPTLNVQRAASLALIPDDQAKADGIATGDAAAAAIIALRANDGSSPPDSYVPGPPNQGSGRRRRAVRWSKEFLSELSFTGRM